MKKIFLALSLVLSLGACSQPQGGPDKTVGGAVLGAAWGAGAGAVVGHQVGNTGAGAGVGAGLGAAAGVMAGIGLDTTDAAQVHEEKMLASLKMQNLANQRSIELLQATLDNAIATNAVGGVYQVFFDPEATSMRAGAIANLEVIADSIKASPAASIVNVVGHSDDSGKPEYNDRLAEARARSVSAYLAARGMSMDQIRVKSFGAQRPIASNSTEAGRQLNRRVDIYISR